MSNHHNSFVLLTGGLGYIGSNVAVQMLESGYKLVLIDNLSNSSLGVLENIKSVSGVSPFFKQIDIRDEQELNRLFRDFEIASVIHFAGLKSVGESSDDPLNYYDNNVAGTVSLLKAMSKANVKAMVFSSSATVYGDPEYLPIDESHRTEAINPYGRTKLHIEKILLDLATVDKSWRIINLRYFNPAGAHKSGLLGDAPHGVPNNLIPYVVRVALGSIKELEVYGDDYDTKDGTGLRDYIHISDLAEGHLSALRNLQKLPQNFETFNLGTGSGHTVKEVIRQFESITNKEIPYRVVRRRKGDVAACYASVNRANVLLNWATKYDLKEICSSALRYELMASEPS